MADRARGSLVDRIREFVRAEVKRTSLRKVSVASGVKLGATKKFVDGSVPYERNLRQWKRYFAHEMQKGRAGKPDDSLATADAAVALDMLLWTLPEGAREAAIKRAVESFRAIHADAGVEPPAWIVDFLAGWRPGDDSSSL